MADVTSIDGDHWCLTSDVQDKLRVEIGNQEPDFETAIQEATDSMVSRWAEATGNNVKNRPASDSDLHDLLQQATTYLAASEAHLKFAKNVSAENNGDQRHIFLEQKADQKFAEWKAEADLAPGSDPDDDGVSGIAGEISSSTDDIIVN